MQKHLVTIANLIQEEEQRIKRLVTEMGRNDDSFIIQTFQNEIDMITKNYRSLKAEHESVTDLLLQIELTNEQRDQVMEFAKKIRMKLDDVDYDQKRQIFDLLKFKGVFHYDDIGKWLDVSCAIPADNSIIAINPQKQSLPGLLIKTAV